MNYKNRTYGKPQSSIYNLVVSPKKIDGCERFKYISMDVKNPSQPDFSPEISEKINES